MILLNVPVVQEKISILTSEKLQEVLGVEVQIGRVDFELFNKLIIKDVYLEDQAGDTLFQAKRLAVGFEFIPLFKGRLRFNSAQLFSFQVNLNKETAQSPLNLQFVIDAFASKDTTGKKSDIDLHIQNLNLRRGTFSYHVKDADETPGKFNAKHIKLDNISAKIQVDELTKKSLVAKIERLAFKEKSGLYVDRVLLDLKATDKKAEIKKLELYLKNSNILMENIIADYSNLTDSHKYLEESIVDLTMRPSVLSLQDISPFVPIFSGFKAPMKLEGHLNGNLRNLDFQNFKLTDENNLLIEANLILQNITDKEKLYVDGTIFNSFVSQEAIKKISFNFGSNPENIPAPVFQLGNIHFEGKVSGYPQDMTAYGIFNTDVGSLRADINVGKEQTSFIKGKISSSGIDLKKLLGNNESFGNTSFDIDINAQQDMNKKFYGKINADIGRFEFKNYSYEDIQFAGDFTEKSFNGILNVNSPEGQLTSEGFFKLEGESSEFNFSAKANNIKLDKLNLSQKYKDSELSLNVEANFTGNSIDNLIGYINLTNLRFNSDKGGYYLDTFAINAIQENSDKLLTIKSDLLHGEIRGDYSFAGIIPSVTQTINYYLPSLIPLKKKNQSGKENIFSIDLTIEDLEEFAYIFEIPVVLHNKSKIVGQYNSIYDKFRIEAYLPKFDFQKTRFESGKLVLENPGKEINLNVDVVNLGKNDKRYKFSSSINAVNDSIHTLLKWNDNMTSNYQGGVNFGTRFTQRAGNFPLKTRINFEESVLTFNDSIWTLHPATLVLDSGKVIIDNLVINHGDQHLKIDGTVSKLMEDKLWVDLNKVDLKYIFNTLAIKALTFGGIASGYVEISDLYETRQLSTNLNVKDFSFNDVVFGDLDLSGAWDDKEQGILMEGKVIKNDTSNVNVNGLIYPVKNELSFNFNALNIDAAFLRKYLDNVAPGISGEATGQVRLFGTFKKPTLEGQAYIRNGSFGIGFLNTRYSFSDSVTLKPDEIFLKNVILHDKYGKTALVNGSVKHDHLENFTYHSTLQASDFLVFDATEAQNSAFFGTAFGTGTATIKGNEQVVNVDVSMRSNKNTKITLNFMEESDITDYDFINFVSKKEQDSISIEEFLPLVTKKPILLKTDSKTELRFNLVLDATPDATIEMIMDPISGDKIKGYGKGNLQVQYGTKSPLKIFGNYVIESGNYNFSLQQVIYRDFTIREGSSVAFRGDPYIAVMDVVAVYTLSAYLGDLDDKLIAETPRTNAIVNCILGISGEIEHPNITFDLELPGSNEALERQVKSIINTDDMMNRQIVYLLVLNKFYTIQDNQSASGSKTNDFSSFASATLSSQLSSLLGSMSDNVQIGTRIKTTDGDFTDTEVALLLTSQLLDNRLLFNGNFGYRDNPNMKDKSNFIGDFDLEYKLSRSGEIRLKAYNHYSENYYNLKTRTTQGLGVMFKKDFDKVDDLFIRRKRLRAIPSVPLIYNDSLPITYIRQKEDFIFFR